MNNSLRITQASMPPLLRMALVNGIKSAVAHQIDCGIDVNASDEKGRTALILAASRGYEDICALLLEHGAILELSDLEGNSATSIALKNSHQGVVLLFQRYLSSHSNSDETHSQLTERKDEFEPLSSEEDIGSLLLSSTTDINSEQQNEYFNGSSRNTPVEENDAIYCNLSAWEEESEPVIPEADPVCLLEVGKLQHDISLYEPMDRDENWSDIDIDFPEICYSRRDRFLENEDDWLPEVGKLFYIGLRDLIVSEAQIAAVVPEDDDDDNLYEDFKVKLKIALEDFGVMVDGQIAWSEWLNTCEDIDFYDLQIDECIEHFKNLVLTNSDSENLYRKEVRSKKTLSREEELKLSQDIEDGEKNIIRAIVSSPIAILELITSLRRAVSGEIRLQSIVDEDGNDVEVINRDKPGTDTDAVSRPTIQKLQASIDYIKGLYDSNNIGAELINEIYNLKLTEKFIFLFQESVYVDPNATDATYMMEAGLYKIREARARLVESNLRLVLWAAKRYRGLPYMDLVQEGNLGLMKAAKRFDSRRGSRFSAYALWWIRQSISRAITNYSRTIRIPTHIYEDFRRVSEAIQSTIVITGEILSYNDLANDLSIPVDRIKKIRTIPDEPLNFDELVQASFPSIEEMADLTAQNPEDSMVQSSLQQAVNGALNTIPEKEAEILRMRFGIGRYDEHTLEEIGAKYGVTRERIRQIESSAIDKISHPTRSRLLKQYLGMDDINVKKLEACDAV